MMRTIFTILNPIEFSIVEDWVLKNELPNGVIDIELSESKDGMLVTTSDDSEAVKWINILIDQYKSRLH